MRFRIDLKILFFLFLFYFTKQLDVYCIVMFFAFTHEICHVIMALFLKFKIQFIEIMPFGFFTKIEANIDDYNKKIKKSNLAELKKIFVVIAGPLSNLLIMVIFYLLKKNIFINKYEILIYSNLSLFLFNILPIFPLDGGRICKSIFKILFGFEKANFLVHNISYITGFILTLISIICVFHFKNISLIFINIYIWKLILKT